MIQMGISRQRKQQNKYFIIGEGKRDYEYLKKKNGLPKNQTLLGDY